MISMRHRCGKLAMAAVILTVTACGSSSPSLSPGAFHLVQPGCLTVGTVQSPQFSEIAPDGSSGGLEGILWTDAAKNLGLKQCPALYDFAALIPALQAGRIDMIAAGMSLTEQRGQIFYFGPPYLWAPEALAVKASDVGKLTTYEQAKSEGLTLGSQVGYFNIGLWQQMGVNFKAYDSTDACMQDILNGVVYGCAGALNLLPYELSQNPNSAFKALALTPITGPLLTEDLNGQVFNRDNPNLALAMTQQIINFWRDGTVDKVWDQIFGVGQHALFTDPPKGYNVYIQGPWEDGAVPPAPTTYPTVKTITSGTLTVGVPAGSALISGTGDSISGAEGAVITYVAGKLGLKVNVISETDPAAAVRSGQVDVIAGGIPATADSARQFWQSTPTAFSPDYMYVKLTKDGSFPTYTDWADAAKDGPLAVIAGSPRIADLTNDGDRFTTFPDAKSALTAVANGAASAFVGTAIDFVTAVAADPTLQKAELGFVRNDNVYTSGTTYSWGVKAGNGQLLDALNQGITAAWQQKIIVSSYQTALPGANVTAMMAPGPAFDISGAKDYTFRGMWVPGPWAQVPGYVNP